MFETGPDSYGAQISQLAAALSIPHDPMSQDWGIESADPDRVGEFVAFAQHEFCVGWHPEIIRELVDLVFQSAEDALADNDSLQLADLRDWLVSTAPQLETQLTYWLGLDPTEWAIVARMHAWGLNQRRAS